jgi:predicted anti-sigma-YlaC factor YlaD
MSFFQVPMAAHGMKQYLHVQRCTKCNAIKAYVGTNYWASHDAMFKRKATPEETKLGIETLKKMSQRQHVVSSESESY